MTQLTSALCSYQAEYSYSYGSSLYYRDFTGTTITRITGYEQQVQGGIITDSFEGY